MDHDVIVFDYGKLNIEKKVTDKASDRLNCQKGWHMKQTILDYLLKNYNSICYFGKWINTTYVEGFRCKHFRNINEQITNILSQ